MKNILVAFISFFVLVGCSRKMSSSKPMSVANKENDLDKAKKYANALGFDTNRVTVELNAKVNPDSVLRFKSVEEGRAYFKEYIAALNKPKPITCIDTLMMLSRAHSKYYYPYLNSLKERAREMAKKPIPGYDYNSTEWQQIPDGYECLLVLDTIINPSK
ncbi:hypothetical protein [Pinibacter aurantiacus]|uniref:Lipoprotein n=1 Tax=Pinibacter aurantiacus TaxID=2851599 RepID=A0A9E2S7C4_9BACT|nr:hypothetical protein [Pinibacter aurantiacus]MBV4356323.1 hypothetical protein [Pinibacter aurantiacus]